MSEQRTVSRGWSLVFFMLLLTSGTSRGPPFPITSPVPHTEEQNFETYVLELIQRVDDTLHLEKPGGNGILKINFCAKR